MHLHFLGGASGVGASCLVVEAADARVLVDAGVRLDSPDPLPDLARLQDLSGIGAAVVTHAHADHIGALPLAAGAFPAAPVLATPPTAALMRVMLEDAVRIGRLRAEAGGDLPAYGQPQVEALLERLRPLPFGRPYPLLPGWLLTLWPAGHVLGAAMAWLDTPEGPVLCAGDVSVAPQRTVGPAAPPRRRPVALVLESTYGARLHSRRANEEARLVAQVRAVLERGGHCLIPAFALGRAQEVLLVLSDARRRGLLPESAGVWVDGLVRAVCHVYAAHADSGSAALRRLADRSGNPFFPADGVVRAVGRHEERQAILQGPPAVIVASSGMLVGGPSSFYAAALAADPRAAILITGYQDEESPGRRLLDLSNAPAGTPRRLALGDVEVDLRCEVARYNLSAHADGDELAALAERLRPHLTLLVHGDGDARAALAGKLVAHQLPTRLPEDGDSVELPARRRFVHVVARPDPTAAQLAEIGRAGGPRRPWSAVELAERYYGQATPEGVAHVDGILAADGGPFVADPARPGMYRLAPAPAPAPNPGDPWPQDQVRRRLEEALAGDATFVRASLHPADRRVELSFHFPRSARGRLANLLPTIQGQTGWRIDLRPHADLGAVQAAAARHLPDGLQPLGLPALHEAAGLVVVGVDGTAAAEDVAAAREAFRSETGYDLALRGAGLPALEASSVPIMSPSAEAAAAPLNQQAAFAAVRTALRAQGLSVYHVALRAGVVEVSLLTPALGRRYEALLAELAQRIGRPIAIAPQPQQAPLIGLVRQIVGRRIAKGPGLFPDEERVGVRLAPDREATPDEVARWSRAVEEQTGYRLDVEPA